MSTDAKCIRYLRDYIAIPSINPMGRDDIPTAHTGERRYAEHLLEEFRRLRLDAELIGDPERPSVIAEARAPGATETIMIASHLDTVPVDGMEIDPFDPTVSDERVYGRGSCDTKSGMAALVAAVEQLLESGRLAKNVILVGEADEELSSQGARDVVERLGLLQPDWAIATEPTGMQIITAHKGIAIAKLCARGRACHSSQPEKGSNAIVSLARAILALDAHATTLKDSPHAELGPGTLSVGVVSGGQAPNIVPDEARLTCDRRLLPGEDAESVREQLETVLREHGLDELSVFSCELGKPALDMALDHPSVIALKAALTRVGLEPATALASFGTDAGVFATAGLPSVVLGPGSIAQAHTSREYVPIAEVEQMTELCTALLSVKDAG